MKIRNDKCAERSSITSPLLGFLIYWRRRMGRAWKASFENGYVCEWVSATKTAQMLLSLPKNPVKQHTLWIHHTMPQHRKFFWNRRCLFELYWRALSHFPLLESFRGSRKLHKRKHQRKYHKIKTTFKNSKQLCQVVYSIVSGELYKERGKLWRQPTLHTWRENEIDVAN